tara:strand:+ start:1002 stop:1703 length:702 start_codon:yes stop_codon:yes gene_type:complete
MLKNYYAIIPADVRYNKNLTANAKLLYGEITALTNEKGFCWASNSYFSELYKVEKGTISRWISQLEKNDHISTKLIYKKDSKEVERRVIKIDNRYKQKNGEGIGKIVKDNIYTINTNNTINNSLTSKNVKSEKDFPPLILDSYNHIVKLFPKQTQPKTKNEKLKWLSELDKLQRLDGYNPRQIYLICSKVRNDNFWSQNFLSITKLRQKNKEGIKYIQSFEYKFAKDLKHFNL